MKSVQQYATKIECFQDLKIAPCQENGTRSGRHFASLLYVFHGPLLFVTSHSTGRGCFVRILRFFYLLFWCKINKKKLVWLNSRKKRIFFRLYCFKGVSPRFLSKIDIFRSFFFFEKNRSRKNCFVKILKEKKPFESLKT